MSGSLPQLKRSESQISVVKLLEYYKNVKLFKYSNLINNSRNFCVFFYLNFGMLCS